MEKETAFLESLISKERLERIRKVVNSKIKNITVVLDNLLDSHNTSAILRTSEALGLTDVLVIEKDYQFEISKSVSKYSHKWINITRFGDYSPCVNFLKEKGYKIAVANVGEKSVKLQDIEISPKNKIAFVVGNEHDGISKEILKYADLEFTIPMFGFTESFNVSVAAAIILSHSVYVYRKFLRNNTDLTNKERRELYYSFLKKAVKNSEIILKQFKKDNNL